MAFAVAEMLADPSGPSTLADIENNTKRGHGLYTLDGASEGVQDIVVSVLRSGFLVQYGGTLRQDTGGRSEITEVASVGPERKFRAGVDNEGLRVWWDALNLHVSPSARPRSSSPALGTSANTAPSASCCSTLCRS